MIEEQARVIDIDGDQLLLQAQTQSACGACAAKKGCGTAVLSKVIGRKFTHFQAENSIDAKIGDTVIVGIAEDALLTGSAVIYIVPIFAMIALALMADFLFAFDLDQRDLYVAASAILGLALGSLFSKYYFQAQSSTQKYTPVVLRKLL